MNIEVYSVKGFTGNLLKAKLQEALDANKLNCSICLINNVDRFIEAGLSSVPALRIGNKIIENPTEMELDDMIRKAVDFILEVEMPSILVPIDFSKESIHGLHYAKMMAGILGLNITLVHVQYPIYDPVSSGALNIQLINQNEMQLQKLANQLMEEEQPDRIKVHVSTQVEEGEVNDSLIDLLQNKKYEMMVMGTKGIDTGIRRMFGTISSRVGLHSHKPVIIVPPYSEMKFPEKIVIGFSEELIIDNVLDSILTFGAGQQIFFDFVHVSDDDGSFITLKQKLYNKLMKRNPLLGGFTIRSEQLKDQQIHEVLFNQADEIEAGMIVLVTKHRNFLDNLRHKSVTKKAIQQATIPLMILHPPVDNGSNLQA